jgi:hypothetical protein
MKFSVSIETGTSIQLHSGMPKNLVMGKEFLKLLVTYNDRIWTENNAYCLRHLNPSNNLEIDYFHRKNENSCFYYSLLHHYLKLFINY